MEFIESFRHKLKQSRNHSFEDLALEAFQFQAINNRIYNQYIQKLNINPIKVDSIEKIPFLPIEFFKTHEIKSSQLDTEITFLSSGTTLKKRSQHHLDDLDFYLDHSTKIFESHYTAIEDLTIIAVLPSYLEQGDSSLIAMVDHFIKKSNHTISGYYLQSPDEIEEKINTLDSRDKVLVIGVSYALLDLAEKGTNLKNCIVMETGGMKGRRKEMIREELHSELCKGLNVNAIHSEYGMTELMSQAYSKGFGLFSENNSLKIMVRDINDPLSYVGVGRTGGLNVIDLGNIFSCCFVETKDIGRKHENGEFEVLGRFDNSDLRGCNLMLV
ncbi:MAG: acyl transferase [bacterium]|nr:acyl transferase [bacterium]